ncbi:PKD domain-containing protein [Candidatus Peregrinibacteria bacterium]|nr:PKD domain-containing protein [Candidatus Peregrinibacteria bacterium]
MKYKNIIKIGMIAAVLLATFSLPVKVAAEWTWDPTETTWWNADDKEDIVSFSDFQGGLEAPTGEGLSKTLIRVGSAREFIKNTVNLALSFLGIIAMAIIIYGGFLYITAAGNEEQSGKGKKAITYAGIGIIIIIASFAIVNTLISFVGTEGTDRSDTPGGAGSSIAGEQGSGAGAGSESGSGLGTYGAGTAGGGQQAIYNLGVVEINASLKEFMGAYKNLVAVDSLMKKIKVMAKPKDVSENKAYFGEAVDAINQINNKSNALSKTHVAAKNLLDGWIAEVGNMDFSAPDFKYKNNLKESFEKELPKIEEASVKDFTGAIESIKDKLDIVKKILGPTVDKTAGAAINEAVQNGFINEKDIAKALAGIDSTTTIGEIFQTAKSSIDAAKKLAEDSSQTDLVINAVKSLHDLYVVVKNIQFVTVKIKASVKEGNAPLIVELNGLDSRDPAGTTIPEENYEWDPDGDGKPGANTNKVECNKDKGPTITCIYKQTGTYIVGLSVASQDALRIAAGKATFAVIVKPSIARIALKATAGSISEELRKYSQDASGQWQILIDKTEFQVTTSEAKGKGVSYDASESKGGDDQALTQFDWTFGDGTPPEKDKKKIDNRKYSREGKFQLMLEVTDSGKRKDRKIVSIIVASIAARIGTAKTIAEPDELVEFDGSLSRSDNGQINSYVWTVVNEKGTDITNLKNDLETVGNPDSANLRVKFKKPGSYTVKLEVSDGNKSANAQVPISIKSRKPRANFTIKTCPENCADKTHPAVAQFDASSSFDPDKSDVLTYEWNFSDESDQKLEKELKFKVLENGELSGKNAKKLKVEFFEAGKYKAHLKVNDSHEDQNILQEDEKEKGFEIASIVEAYWNRDIKTVEQLKEGKAGFEFAGKVKNADRVEIDFGDDQSDEKGIDAVPRSEEKPFGFEHEYDKAGSFLVSVKATSSEGNGENTLQKRVYVSNGDSPLAVMQIFEDKNEIILPEEGDAEPFETIRNKLIKFDASNSINSAGEKNEKGKDVLVFSWNFGDSKKSTGAIVEHSYEDVSPEGNPFKVTLTVTEAKDPTKLSEAKFLINVVGKKPELNTLSLEKKSAGETTPVDVEVTAEGAIDPDGKVKNYQFWYYDPLDKEQKLGVVDTQYNQATLTIETAGEADEEHEYIFCVNLTDNENVTSNCEELFGENELPKIKVKNGPNKAPISAFSADKTNAKVGEAITFTSSSKDEDGKIKEYIWDFDGDGFQNDNPTELSAITHTYTKPSPKNGYKVKLKAIDDKNAAGFSKEIPIYIVAKSNPPKANFSYIVEANPPRHVKFFDSSTADTDNGAKIIKWTWDFDTSSEFGCDKAPKPEYCNGNKADDIDSQDQNPFYDFPSSATYQVKLTVEDSDGNISEPKTAIVNVISGATGSGGTPGAPTAVSNILNAELKTLPQWKWIGSPPQKTIVIPKGSKGETVAFFYGDSTGSIISYKLDKNIWCDSGGKLEKDPDGNRANDVDFIYPDPDNANAGKCVNPSTGAEAESCWTANYSAFAKTAHKAGSGHFTAKLTTSDITNAQDEDTVEIVFEDKINETDVLKGGDCDGKIPKSPFAGSLFNQLNYSNSILLGLGAGVIVILSIFGIFNLIRKGGKRE